MNKSTIIITGMFLCYIGMLIGSLGTWALYEFYLEQDSIDFQPNISVECNADNILNEINNSEQEIKQSVYDWRSVCNTNFYFPKEEDSFYRVLAQNSIARPYEIDVYDCTEFAENTAHDLNELGWRAKDIYVTVDCDSGLFEKSSCEKYDGGHRIVRVDKIYVEAVSGVIIPPWNYEHYGIK